MDQVTPALSSFFNSSSPCHLVILPSNYQTNPLSSRTSRNRHRAQSFTLTTVTTIAALLALLSLAPLASADFPKPDQQQSDRPYPQIEITHLTFTQPRPLHVWSAKVDLASPDVELVVTPRGDVGDEYETACANTLQFARDTGTLIAVNASPFRPFRKDAGQGMDVVGLSASDGDVYSEPHEQFGAMLITHNREAHIVAPPIDPKLMEQIDDAVGGFHLLIQDGRDVSDKAIAQVAPNFANVNPRSAVALSEDRRILWFIVADGRQPGKSEGLTLKELTDLGKHLGCHHLLNLDGGGSTTLVLKDPATSDWRVINSPSGSALRLVANNLGVRIRTSKPEQP